MVTLQASKTSEKGIKCLLQIFFAVGFSSVTFENVSQKSPLLKGPEVSPWQPPVQPKIGIKWVFFGAQLAEDTIEMGLHCKNPVGKLTERG